MNPPFRLVPLLATLAFGAACVSRDKQPASQAAASPTRAATSAASSAGCTAKLVTADGVGPVRINALFDSVRQACPIVGDTAVQPDVGLPGEHFVSVLMGTDTALVSVRRGHVLRVLLTGARFATADSVRVGTPLGRLLRFGQVKGYGVSGDLLIVTAAKCGLMFGIAGRYTELPDGVKDSATLSRVPPSAAVNRIRIDGCGRDDDEFAATDDSTFDVQTDSTLLARDLDGNGVTDFVIRESRPYQRNPHVLYRRAAVYLDSIPASRTPAWASGWDIEGDAEFGELTALAHGSLLLLYANGGDYTGETMLAIRDGTIAEEMTHGEDYGRGFLEILKEGGKVVVDASQTHLTLRGKPVEPELECKGNDWAAVRMPWDESARRFVAERPRCVKPR